MELLVEDEREQRFYRAVFLLASAVRESGAEDLVVPALQRVFHRARAMSRHAYLPGDPGNSGTGW